MCRRYMTYILLIFILDSLCALAQFATVPGKLSFSVTKAANSTSNVPKATRPQSCGACNVGGPNVDVYYWPQASANTSCLSIIGPSASPPLAGATISNGLTYWGSPETMVLTAINGITFKMPLEDPWPYTTPSQISFSPYTLMEPIGKRAYAAQPPILIEPRAPFNESSGSSLGNNSVSARSTFTESTVVLNGHTLYVSRQRHRKSKC